MNLAQSVQAATRAYGRPPCDTTRSWTVIPYHPTLSSCRYVSSPLPAFTCARSANEKKRRASLFFPSFQDGSIRAPFNVRAQLFGVFQRKTTDLEDALEAAIRNARPFVAVPSALFECIGCVRWEELSGHAVEEGWYPRRFRFPVRRKERAHGEGLAECTNRRVCISASREDIVTTLTAVCKRSDRCVAQRIRNGSLLESILFPVLTFLMAINAYNELCLWPPSAACFLDGKKTTTFLVNVFLILERIEALEELFGETLPRFIESEC